MYLIKLYERGNSSEPYYTFSKRAKTIEKAAIKAAKELEKTNFIVGYKEVWYVKIINTDGKDYEILKNGEWLINTQTGKKLSGLEKKLD